MVLTKGVDGQLLCTDNVFYVDGVETDRIPMTEIVIRRSVTAVIAIGTGEAGSDGSILLAAP